MLYNKLHSAYLCMCVCVHACVHAYVCVCLFGYSLVLCLLGDVYLVFLGLGGCCIRFLVFEKELKVWVGMEGDLERLGAWK